MYSCGPPHMTIQKQDDQLEHTCSSYVMIRDVTLKTCQRWWMIGRRGERGSGDIRASRTTWWWWWWHYTIQPFIQICFCLFLRYILLFLSIYHHHHHIALVARISLTLSRHSSLSFIALGRSSGQHPVSSHSCWMYVRGWSSCFCAAMCGDP